jgi:hypothetical protein
MLRKTPQETGLHRPRAGGTNDWKLGRLLPFVAVSHGFHRHGVGGERARRCILAVAFSHVFHRRRVGGGLLYPMDGSNVASGRSARHAAPATIAIHAPFATLMHQLFSGPSR